MYRRIKIVVNPASGQDRPMLNVFNSVFGPAGVDWDVGITKGPGDARRLAEEALADQVDAVGVYGGDGTILEVAGALVGSSVPLAVFPGGTANALSVALGIPGDLAEACALVGRQDSELRSIDVGQTDQSQFLIAVGIGILGTVAEEADRAEKDRLGTLAYALKILESRNRVPLARYQITLDGRQVESEGVTCVIANSGNFGIRGLSLAQSIDMADGLLDVLVIHSADMPYVLSLAASVVTGSEERAPFEHWQAREVEVVVDPPQAVQADGEVLEPGPIHARVIPQALRIIVPGAHGEDEQASGEP